METKGMVFRDGFADSLEKWTIYGTACLGKWLVEDGELIYDLLPKDGMGRGFISTRSRFLKIHSVEMEFFVEKPAACEVDMWLRSYGYTSMGRLLFETNGSQQVKYTRLDSAARTGVQLMLCNDLTQDSGIQWGQWNRYCMKIDGQRFSLYLNDRLVLEYEDPDYPVEIPMCLHLKTTVDGTRFRNVTVLAQKEILPDEALQEQVEPGAYIAQMTPERERPYGFLEEAGEKDWSMTRQQGDPVYGTCGTEHLTATWLHCFEKDGEVSADIMYTDPGEEGCCGIFARFAVEDSYLRAGYDKKEKAWFIASTLGRRYRVQTAFSGALGAMEPGRYYQLRLEYTYQTACLYVNGEEVVSVRDLGNTAYGRMGLFAEKTDLYARSFACSLPSGGQVTDGVLEQTLVPDQIYSHMEIERLDENRIYGQFLEHCFISEDCGVHFTVDPEAYRETAKGSGYPSIHRRLSDGKFIQLQSEKDFTLRESEDLRNWTDLCRILPPERIFDERGRYLALIHVSSMTELPMPDGSTRIFLPIAFRNYMGDFIAGHYTNVFYSDDGGRSWQESVKNVRDLPNFPVWDGNMSWCESKIIRCADGRLRMLCSRTLAPCMYYADSFDNGQTWTEYGELKDLITPTTSFAICPDPVCPGTYLMVYVNNIPHFCSTIFPRTRLTLVRTDGLRYEKLRDIDRFNTSEDPAEGSPELYQLLDPCINVYEDYIFISFGRSDDIGDAEHPHHNGQRIRFVRIDRKKAGL